MYLIKYGVHLTKKNNQLKKVDRAELDGRSKDGRGGTDDRRYST